MKEYKTYTLKFTSELYKTLKHKTIETDNSMQDLLIELIKIGLVHYTPRTQQTNQDLQTQ